MVGTLQRRPPITPESEEGWCQRSVPSDTDLSRRQRDKPSTSSAAIRPRADTSCPLALAHSRIAWLRNRILAQWSDRRLRTHRHRRRGLGSTLREPRCGVPAISRSDSLPGRPTVIRSSGTPAGIPANVLSIRVRGRDFGREQRSPRASRYVRLRGGIPAWRPEPLRTDAPTPGPNEGRSPRRSRRRAFRRR